MKFIRQAIWIALLFPFLVIGQESGTGQLYPIKVAGKWGFMNALGEVIITPAFDGVGNFGMFNHAPVFQKDQAGLMHINGQMTIPPQYEDVFFLNESLIAIKENGYYGVADTTGKQILSCAYSRIQLLNPNILAIYQNEKVGMLSLQSREIVPPQFDAIECIDDRYFIPEKNKKFGYIDETGTLAIAPIHDEIKVAGSNAILFRDSSGLWGCYDSAAALILQPEYNNARILGSELIRFRRSNQYHLYSSATNSVIKIEQVNKVNFTAMTNQVAYYLKARKVGLIHSSGIQLLPCDYDTINYVDQSVVITYKDGEQGIYSLRTRQEISPQFHEVEVVQQVLKVRRSGLWGLANSSGELILEPEYNKIDLLKHSGKAYQGSVLTTVNLDSSGRLVTENAYENFRTLRVGGSYRTSNTNMTGTINSQRANAIVRTDGWFYSRFNRKWGLLSANGDTLIKPKYDQIEANSRIGLTMVSNTISPPVEFKLDGYTITINKLYGVVKQSIGKQLGFVSYWKIYFEDFNSAEVARVIKPGGKFSLLYASGAMSRSANTFIGPFLNERARFCMKGKVKLSAKYKQDHLGNIEQYLKGVSINDITTNSSKRIDADELNISIDKGQWGYINSRGEVIHKSNLNFARDYHHNRAVVKINNHYGLIDLNGELVIPPVYGNINFLEESSDSLYLLDRYKYLYGFIDNEGRLVVETQYRNAGKFSEGLAPVKIKKEWGYVNASGELVIDATFRKVGSFSEGLAAVKNHKYGYINFEGDTIINCQFSRAGKFKEGLAPVMYRGKYGLIDTNGDFAIKPKYRMCSEVSNGLVIVKKNNKLGIKLVNDKWLLTPRFSKIGPFDEHGYAIAKKGNQYGVIDVHGKTIVGFHYQKILPFNEGRALVRKNALYGYVDLNGDEVIKPRYVHAGSFCNGLAPVREKKLWGFIDQNGQMSIDQRFHNAAPFSEGRALVSEGLVKGFINVDGEFVFKTKSKIMSNYKENRVIAREKGKYFFLNEHGRQIPDEYFDAVLDFENGLSMVKRNGKWGIINAQGSYVFQPKYDDMELFSEGKSRVRVNAFSGLANLTGTKLIDCEYEVIRYAGEGLYRVEQHDQLGYLDIEGNWVWRMQD